MALSESALLATVVERIKRASRERLPLTSKTLSEELAVFDIPAWQVESAIYSLEHSRKIAVAEDGLLSSSVSPTRTADRLAIE
jgi:hypothetical protein